MSKLKRRIKTKYKSSRIFVVIPGIVNSNTDLNSTDKIILSWIHGYKKTWNNISTDTIATTLNLTRETINHSIRKLVFLDLIEEKYTQARKRSFRTLLEPTNDAAAIITDSVLSDKSITNAYKISMGVIVAATVGKDNSLGGFNFNTQDHKGIQELANRLGLSISSVYRHLALLTEKRFIERDYGSYFIEPQDPYVRNHTNNVRKQKQADENLSLAHMPPDELTPEVSDYLDSIYSQI